MSRLSSAPLTDARTVSVMWLNPTATPMPAPARANEPWPASDWIVAVSNAETATAPDLLLTSAPPEIAAVTVLAIRLTETEPPTAKSAAPEPATVALSIVADSPLMTDTDPPVTLAPEIPAAMALATSLVEIAAPTAPADGEIASAPAPAPRVELSVAETMTAPRAMTWPSVVESLLIAGGDALADEVQIERTPQREPVGPRAADRHAHELRADVDGDRHAGVSEVERGVRAGQVGGRAEVGLDGHVLARGHLRNSVMVALTWWLRWSCSAC